MILTMYDSDRSISVSYNMSIIPMPYDTDIITMPYIINCNDTDKNTYDTDIYIIQHEYHSCMTSYHTA